MKFVPPRLLCLVILAICGGISVFASDGRRFVPVTPCRLVDTREASLGAFGTPFLAANSVRSFAIPARAACGIPATAGAYALNVTVVPKGALGYLTLFPTGGAQPFVSTLNSPDGRIKANAAIVPAGTGGAISIYVTDATDVILDINGYFIDPAVNSQALAFYPLVPCRVLDTRNPNGELGGPVLAGGVARSFPVLSSNCGVPANAQAYSVNATVVPSGGSLGYLTLWPTEQNQPFVSTLNAPTGTIVANAAIVPTGRNGAISAFAANHTHLVIDINGYFAPAGGANAQDFYSVAPCRLLDTREALGEFGGPMLSAGAQRSYRIPLTNCSVPSSAKAYSLNSTIVPPAFLGYLTLWPFGSGQPFVSTLNAIDGAITSNAAIVPAGTAGAVASYVTNQTHLILDINGYFATTGALTTLTDPTTGVSVIIPDGWASQLDPGPNTLAISNVPKLSPESSATLLSESLFQVRRLRSANPARLAINQWFDSYFVDGFSGPILARSETTVDGRSAVRIELTEIVRTAHLYVPDGPDVIAITHLLNNPALSTHYNNILAKLKIASVSPQSEATNYLPRSAQAADDGRDAVYYADDRIGRPYAEKPRPPDSFDCSSLMQYVFGKIGISLPRKAIDQSAVGFAVSAPFQRGDLLFFSTQGPGVITHVGIYESGTSMIHAPRPGKNVSRTTSDSWNYYWMTQGVFVKARRIGRRATVGPPDKDHPLTVNFTTKNCAGPLTSAQYVQTSPPFITHTWVAPRLEPLLQIRSGQWVAASGSFAYTESGATSSTSGTQVEVLTADGILTINRTGQFRGINTLASVVSTGRLNLNTGEWASTVKVTYAGSCSPSNPEPWLVDAHTASATLPVTLDEPPPSP